jgi:hypothetical protein
MVLFVTMLAGAMYAACGLFTSLTDFGVGVAVSAAAVVGQGLLEHLHHTDAKVMARYRADVWARRDHEAGL